jgi:4-carboxymuconolactone decarboxylase
MSRLPALTPDELDPDQRALYDSITTGPRAHGTQHFALTRPDGSLAGPFNALLLSPPVGSAMDALGSAIRYGTSLSSRMREIAILMVASRCDSAFERHAHEAVGRAVGLADAELEAIREGGHAAYEDVREQATARLVRAMLDGDVDDETWRECAETVGTQAVFELTALVGYYSTLALQLRVFRADVTK